MRWVDAWAAERSGSARCLVQCGTSRPPTHAEWSPYLSHHELQSALDDASAVVSHAGPGTIIECRRRGIVPIVVPRRPELGEHVDEHQVRFSHRLAVSGGILVCEEESELRSHLDRLSDDSSAFRTPPDGAASTETADRFAELVTMLVEGRARDGSWVSR